VRTSHISSFLHGSAVPAVLDLPYSEVRNFLAHLIKHELKQALANAKVFYASPPLGIQNVSYDPQSRSGKYLEFTPITERHRGITPQMLAPRVAPAFYDSFFQAVTAIAGEEATPHIFVVQGLAGYAAKDTYVRTQLAEYTLNAAGDTNKRIIAIEPGAKVPGDLIDCLVKLDYEYPTLKEIEDHVRSYASAICVDETAVQERDQGGFIRRMALALCGSTSFSVGSGLVLSTVLSEDVDENAISLAEELRKDRMAAMGLTLEDPPKTKVGGMDLLKAWLRRRKSSFVEETNMPIPKGILLVGSPGNGKSLVAKSISQEWGVPCFNFSLAQCKSSLYGESESRFKTVLKIVSAAEPAVLFIDEIEKSLGGLDDTTGINRALLGILLTWMQDRESRVFVVATCNSIGAMPPELLRRGRFNEIFFVGNPDWKDRIEILTNALKATGLPYSISQEELEAFACYRIRDFSGAEIASLVQEAILESQLQGELLTCRHLQEAVKEFPVLQAHNSMFQQALQETEKLCLIAKPVSSPPGRMPKIADSLLEVHEDGVQQRT